LGLHASEISSSELNTSPKLGAYTPATPSASRLVGPSRDASGVPGVDRIESWSSSTETLAGSRGPSCLRWVRRSAASSRDSSLGVHQRSPLRQYRCRASTPGWAEARPSARSCHAPGSFRPCRYNGFDGFLRSTPCRSVAPCIRPWGSLCFRSAPGGPSPEGSGPVARLPRQRSALRSFPRRSRSRRVTASRCPLAVVPGFQLGSSRVATGGGPSLPPFARPQGFAPLRSTLHLPTLPSASRSLLPWALSQARPRCQCSPTASRKSRWPAPRRAPGGSSRGPKVAGLSTESGGSSPCPKVRRGRLRGGGLWGWNRCPEGIDPASVRQLVGPGGPAGRSARGPPEGGLAAGSLAARVPKAPAAVGRTGWAPEGACPGFPRCSGE
jgi:hypothetical protein